MSYKLAQEIRARHSARVVAPNRFEEGGRREKVAKLAAAVERVRAEMPPMSNERAAAWLVDAHAADRARIHLLAGVKRRASPTTWAALVDAVRTGASAPAIDDDSIGSVIR